MNKKKNNEVLRMCAVLLAMVVTVTMVPVLTLAGNLEPTGPPGPTMKTLNEIPPTWSQTFPLASDRFELVLFDEAVLDKETGLVWARNAEIYPTLKASFLAAIRLCRNLEIGGRKGWRLPTVEELASLVDPVSSDPALPAGYSSFFDNVLNEVYWSSTALNIDNAWGVDMTTGDVEYYGRNELYHIWPVRGGSWQHLY